MCVGGGGGGRIANIWSNIGGAHIELLVKPLMALELLLDMTTGTT